MAKAAGAQAARDGKDDDKRGRRKSGGAGAAPAPAADALLDMFAADA